MKIYGLGDGRNGKNTISLGIVHDVDTLISKNLLRLIAARGLKQNELAARIEVAPTVINDYLAGRKQIGKSTMQRLCEVLGVDVWEFYVTEATPIVTDPGELQALQRHRAARILGVAEEVSNYESFRIQEAEKAASGKKNATMYPVPIDLTADGREALRLFHWTAEHDSMHQLLQVLQQFQKKMVRTSGKKRKKRP